MSISSYDNSVQALLYLTLTFLRMRRSEEREGALFPELLYVFEVDDLLKFISLFGGRKIRVPSLIELREGVMVIVYFYARTVLKMSDEQFSNMFSISGHKLRVLRDKMRKWQRFLVKDRIVVPKEFLKSNSQLLKDLNEMLMGGRFEKKSIQRQRKKRISFKRKLSSRGEKLRRVAESS